MNCRPIKFRIWDKANNVWITNHELDSISSWSRPFNSIFTDNKNCVFQQFTGIKDKNGKEIYEGDILGFGGLNYEVLFSEGAYIAQCPNYQKYHWPRFLFPSTEVRCSEVVGNIFENQKLLA